MPLILGIIPISIRKVGKVVLTAVSSASIVLGGSKAAMATLVSLLLFPILGLFVGTSFGLLDSKLPDPLLGLHGGHGRSPELVTDIYNTTEFELEARSLAKRDFQSQCNQPRLIEGFRQAEDIVRCFSPSLSFFLPLVSPLLSPFSLLEID
jgi:hypothetical protein